MDSADKRFLARTALILFIAGITVPFLIAIFASEDIAIGFGLASEILALILGVISWKHSLGKIAVVGVSLLLTLSSISYMFFSNARSDAMQRMRIEAKEAAEQAASSNH